MPGIVGRVPARKCVVTASFHKNGRLKRIADRDVKPGEDQFLSEVPIFCHRDFCGEQLERDLMEFLLEREATARVQTGLRELVGLADDQLADLYEARRLAWYGRDSFGCAAQNSMALFLRVARLEIEVRKMETSSHARLASISAHRTNLREAEEILEAEREDALAWHYRAGRPDTPFWLDHSRGYDDPTDRIVLHYRSVTPGRG